MSFTPQVLLQELARLEFDSDKSNGYVVAFSGGLDSTVLLHALTALRNSNHSVPSLRCVHIDHGLHGQSADWRQFCENFAASLGVDMASVEVEVPTRSGKGLEAAAREARYRALQAELRPGECLLTAHHRDDQAETLLLNLIRGSGPAGIAGIAGLRRFDPGWLARPLLNVSRAAIEQYADTLGLHWVEDPSNAELYFDRNFLRHELLPLLQGRWPDIAKRLQRSATHASDAAGALDELATLDLADCGQRHPTCLPIDKLCALTERRQRNLIRYTLRCLKLTTPTTAQLNTVLTELIPARADAQPLVRWPGTCVRRYRNGLYLLAENSPRELQTGRFVNDSFDLGEGLGRLLLAPSAQTGLEKTVVDGGLSVRRRIGGERFKPLGQRHTRKLKNLLQEEGIVPWMRDRLPLVYSAERLIAIGDLWVAADVVTASGVALHWEHRPALH